MRLRSKFLFAKLRRSPLKFVGSCTVINYAFGKQWSPLIGLSVSKRFGKAHERNRAKRLFREVFRLNQRALPAGLTINVCPRGMKEQLTYESVTRDFQKFLSSIYALESRTTVSCTNLKGPRSCSSRSG